eukprot:TRINITY_DN4544_c0_g1_i3.p1 TRINITY_DN4544_c0_g1~~TRINITY_DN4544_c0_g1_i3.p1  ORF type:complete len:292 (-),score=47.98 TRINITY_DN4544_c0_g1_i3:53-928(-)
MPVKIEKMEKEELDESKFSTAPSAWNPSTLVSSPFSTEIAKASFVAESLGVPSLGKSYPLANAHISPDVARELEEMKQKNAKLEAMLDKALNDIKALKTKDTEITPYTPWEYNNSGFISAEINPALISPYSIQSFPSEKYTPGMYSPVPSNGSGMIPCTAMFTAKGELVQCNSAFLDLLGRQWDEVKSGFNCTKLFPKRLLPVLCKDMTQMRRGACQAVERDIVVLHALGHEVTCRALCHFIFDESNNPIYKMLYAFPSRPVESVELKEPHSFSFFDSGDDEDLAAFFTGV